MSSGQVLSLAKSVLEILLDILLYTIFKFYSDTRLGPLILSLTTIGLELQEYFSKYQNRCECLLSCTIYTFYNDMNSGQVLSLAKSVLELLLDIVETLAAQELCPYFPLHPCFLVGLLWSLKTYVHIFTGMLS